MKKKGNLRRLSFFLTFLTWQPEAVCGPGQASGFRAGPGRRWTSGLATQARRIRFPLFPTVSASFAGMSYPADDYESEVSWPLAGAGLRQGRGALWERGPAGRRCSADCGRSPRGARPAPAAARPARPHAAASPPGSSAARPARPLPASGPPGPLFPKVGDGSRLWAPRCCDRALLIFRAPPRPIPLMASFALPNNPAAMCGHCMSLYVIVCAVSLRRRADFWKAGAASSSNVVPLVPCLPHRP